MTNILSVVLIIILVLSIYYVIQKRKKAGITGIKTVLTSVCFFLIAIINVLAHWCNNVGILSWMMTVVLLILGAYFTKYMPAAES